MRNFVSAIFLALMLFLSTAPAQALDWHCQGTSSNVERCDSNGNCTPVVFQPCTWYHQAYHDFIRWWNSDAGWF